MLWRYVYSNFQSAFSLWTPMSLCTCRRKPLFPPWWASIVTDFPLEISLLRCRDSRLKAPLGWLRGRFFAVHDRDFLFKCENVQLVILFCLPALKLMIRRWHAIPQLRLPIPFPDISWKKAFSRSSGYSTTTNNDLLPISPGQTCQALFSTFLSLERERAKSSSRKQRSFPVPSRLQSD